MNFAVKSQRGIAAGVLKVFILEIVKDFLQENVVKLGNIHDIKYIGDIMFAASSNDTQTYLVNRKYVCQS